MRIGNIAENLKQGVMKHYVGSPKKHSTFLMASTALGWAACTAANMVGVAVDPKIDKNEKKYLLPREFFDGVANVGLFAAITMSLMKLSEKIVDNGKIKFKDGLELLDKEGAKLDSTPLLKSGLGALASVVGGIAVGNILAPYIRNSLATLFGKKENKISPDTEQYYSNWVRAGFQKPMTMKSFLAFTQNQDTMAQRGGFNVKI